MGNLKNDTTKEEVLFHMTALALAIDEIIKEPIRDVTKEEAIEALQKCGILDKKGNIMPAYKDILTDKK